MLKINCSGCVGCCSKELPLTPVLWPGEEDKFRGNVVAVNTPEGIGYLLRRKENGNCIFLNETHGRCDIYNSRPAECRVYPYLLDFSKPEEGIIKLDTRFCRHLDSLSIEADEFQKFLNQFAFPEEFRKIYESLQNC